MRHPGVRLDFSETVLGQGWGQACARIAVQKHKNIRTLKSVKASKGSSWKQRYGIIGQRE